MAKIDFKKWLPHLLAIGIFLVVTLLYCKPALEGKAVAQHDLTQWKGMAQDAFNYKEANGVFPLWTNSLFGGMPTYNIAFPSNAYVPAHIIKAMSLYLPEPFSYFFLACVCFYFLSQVLRINPWIGILGSIGFAFCSYDPIIIAVGHHTKMITMALMPALLGALILLYNKKYWAGGALTAAFTAALIVNNHLQIIFYMMVVVLFMTIAYVIRWIKAGEYKHMFIAGSIALAAAGIGALTSAVNLFTTYDYSKESMRGGKANLLPVAKADGKAAASSGLDAEYAFRWSYGKPETLSLLVPNVNGGASESLGEDSKFYEALMGAFQSGQLDQQTAQQLSRFGTAYWGDRPFTSGPVYLGAIICLLFALGMLIKSNEHRWWALAAVVLSILMAWGSNFEGFNTFLFNYLPMYNKFRAPAMILVVPQLLFAMIGMIGLQSVLFGTEDAAAKWKTVRMAGIFTGGVLVVALLYYFTASFRSGTEQEMMSTITKSAPQIAEPAKAIINAAGEDRKELFMNDYLRSLAFAGAGFLLLFAFVKNKLNLRIAMAGLLLLSSFDLLAIGRRYLNDANFEEADNTEAMQFVASSNPALNQVLTQIKQDPDPHFRVFNVTGDVFNDALTSAFVRSIGGYHPAKLSIYQDLIEYQLSSGSPNMQVLSMLDTKYFIVPGQQGPEVQQNPYAFGAAWLAKHIGFVKDAAAEMNALKGSNLKDSVAVQDTFKTQIAALPQWDSTASIKLQQYRNNDISYAVNTAGKPQFAVLSEIYYSRGWNAYADGKPVPIVKTNYVLRGVALPAGTQKLELKFEPESYKMGSNTTTITSAIVLVLLLLGLYMQYFRKRSES
ncbi:YfhO family protein [Phnomibacter ginsenosidimutans]|uniref:YfhO family protein n=1 Tax=Phnomibacter ginsenosidimutans TaxID=2676868 RepID=A0A6I6GGY2_9BACT|nr:YfhO family protein [Phnomibacter ginsenosidimutans]QGW27635.1 YfhO family protein [Phnomibacter ginsenosidimutans]